MKYVFGFPSTLAHLGDHHKATNTIMTIRSLISYLLIALSTTALLPVSVNGQSVSFHRQYESPALERGPYWLDMVAHPDSGRIVLWTNMQTSSSDTVRLGLAHMSDDGDLWMANEIHLGDTTLKIIDLQMFNGANGELYLTGTQTVHNLMEWRPLAIRLDPQTLTPIWSNAYPVPGHRSSAATAVTLAGGDLLLVGGSSPPPNTSLYAWSSLTRIDPQGNVKWHRDQFEHIMSSNSILEAPNGDLIIAGYQVGPPAWVAQSFLARLDSNGLTQWSYHYGDSIESLEIKGLQWGANDTILAFGTGGDGSISPIFPKAGLAKIDPQGQLVSLRNYTNVHNQQLLPLADPSGFTVAATTSDFGDGIMNPVLFRYDIHGRLRWSRNYDYPFAVDSSDYNLGIQVFPYGTDGYLFSSVEYEGQNVSDWRAALFNTDTLGFNGCNSFSFLPTDSSLYLSTDTFAYIDTLVYSRVAEPLPYNTTPFSFNDSYLCISEGVWPGDAYHDGIANHEDLLALGLTYGYTDSSRLDTSNFWGSHYALNWSGSFLGGTNWKHADCNGDGVVNADDTLAIQLNYLNTHNKGNLASGGSAQNPPLLVAIPNDTAYIGDTIHAPILLGSQDIPVDSIYGLAFTLLYDQGLVDTNSAWISYDSSWFGDTSNTLGLYHDFWALGSIDGAITRINHTNAAGYSQIATLHIILIDNIEGKRQASEVLHLGFGNFTAITRAQEASPLSSAGDSVVVVDPELFQQDHIYLPAQVKVYPNPTEDLVHLSSENGPIQEVRLIGQGGQIFMQKSFNHKRTSLELDQIPHGFYLLEVRTRQGWTRHKLLIR